MSILKYLAKSRGPQINPVVFDQWAEYTTRRNRVAQRRADGTLNKLESTAPDEAIYSAILKEVYEWDGVMMNHRFMNIWRELDAFSQRELHAFKFCDGELPSDTFMAKLRWILIGRFLLHWPSTCRAYYGRELPPGLGDDVGDAISAPFAGETTRSRFSIITRYLSIIDDPKFMLELMGLATRTNASMVYSFLRYRLPVLGDFRPYEIVTSMSYLAELGWHENDFCFVGHGAKPALVRMFDLSPSVLSTNVADEFWSDLLRTFWAESGDYLHTLSGSDSQARTYGWEWIPMAKQPWPFREETKWTLRTAEDSLCEFRKWIQLWESDPNQRKRPFDPLARIRFQKALEKFSEDR